MDETAWLQVHPLAVGKFRQLDETLQRAYERKQTQTLFRAFEGYRSPEKQRAAYDRKVSRALPFMSAHQYGLAVDFVGFVDGRWSWDSQLDWAFLRLTARSIGLLTPLDWDLAHVEHPLWVRVRDVIRPTISGSAA